MENDNADVRMVAVPPVGAYIVAGCGTDLLINICLTLLGYVLCFFFFAKVCSTADRFSWRESALMG